MSGFLRKCALIVCLTCLALVGSFTPHPLTTQVASAAPRCDTPGVLRNNSSFWIFMQYDDSTGTRTQWVAPGEVTTKYTCDADFFTIAAGKFQLRIGTAAYDVYQPNQWAKIGWNYIECINWNHPTNGSIVSCQT
ncbi:MAG: hypothetical protein OHK0022_06530 [Roseiflexaceae bacterium]